MIHKSKELIQTSYTSWAMAKHSPLTPVLEKYVFLLKEFGILQHILDMVLFTHYPAIVVKQEKINDQITLDLNHYLPVFILWAGALVPPLICFSIEFFKERSIAKTRVRKF